MRILLAGLATAAIVGAVVMLVVQMFAAIGSWAPLVLSVFVVAFWILPRWLPPALDPWAPEAWVRYLGSLWRWALDEPFDPSSVEPTQPPRPVGSDGPRRW